MEGEVLIAETTLNVAPNIHDVINYAAEFRNRFQNLDYPDGTAIQFGSTERNLYGGYINDISIDNVNGKPEFRATIHTFNHADEEEPIAITYSPPGIKWPREEKGYITISQGEGEEKRILNFKTEMQGKDWIVEWVPDRTNLRGEQRIALLQRVVDAFSTAQDMIPYPIPSIIQPLKVLPRERSVEDGFKPFISAPLDEITDMFDREITREENAARAFVRGEEIFAGMLPGFRKTVKTKQFPNGADVVADMKGSFLMGSSDIELVLTINPYAPEGGAEGTDDLLPKPETYKLSYKTFYGRQGIIATLEITVGEKRVMLSSQTKGSPDHKWVMEQVQGVSQMGDVYDMIAPIQEVVNAAFPKR